MAKHSVQDTETDLRIPQERGRMLLPITLVALAIVSAITALYIHGQMSGNILSAERGQQTEPAQKKEKKPKVKEESEPEPEPEPEEVEPTINEAVLAAITQAAQNAGMTCDVSFIDLTDGSVASYQGDQQIASASMIKLLIAHTFLEQVAAGTQSLDAAYTLQPKDMVGGTGTLTGLGVGATITYRDALMRMIDVSDNAGANILIDTVGMDAINATAQELGLTQTQLNRRMMDDVAIANGIENYTCADDLAKLLRMVYEGTFVDAECSAVMLSALEQQQDWGGILNGLPQGTVFAHKTGSLGTVRHDGGIVEGEHPYVLVVLCGGEGFYEGGAEYAMGQVAQAVTSAMAS